MMNLAIEVTRACNYHCKYCGVNAGEPFKKELTTKEIFGLIKKAKPCYLGLIGGETLLRKDIFKIIDFGKKICRVGIETNGSLLTEKVAEKINADDINISVDAMPKLNSVLRNHKSFQHVENALNNLEKAGKLKRARICITVSKHNLQEVDKVIRHFSPRVRKFGIGKMVPIGRANIKDKPSRIDALKVYLKLIPYMLKNDIWLSAEFGGFFKVIVTGNVVLSDGSIVKCCLVRKPIANIRQGGKLRKFPMLCPRIVSGCAECGQVCSK